MNTADQFKALAQEWADHCKRVRFSSRTSDYLNHPAYAKLVQLGPQAIPQIMERYPIDDLFWEFVLQEITGVQMIEDPDDFSPSEVKRRWLEWWEKQRSRQTGNGHDPLAEATPPAATEAHS